MLLRDNTPESSGILLQSCLQSQGSETLEPLISISWQVLEHSIPVRPWQAVPTDIVRPSLFPSKKGKLFCSLLYNSVEVVIKTKISKVQRKRYYLKKKTSERTAYKDCCVLYFSWQVPLDGTGSYMIIKNTLQLLQTHKSELDLLRMQINLHLKKIVGYFKCLFKDY